MQKIWRMFFTLNQKPGKKTEITELKKGWLLFQYPLDQKWWSDLWTDKKEQTRGKFKTGLSTYLYKTLNSNVLLQS
jgi:hypothetical protein